VTKAGKITSAPAGVPAEFNAATVYRWDLISTIISAERWTDVVRQQVFDSGSDRIPSQSDLAPQYNQ
jgi:hypothetical protein